MECNLCSVFDSIASRNLVDFALQLVIDNHQVIWHLHSQPLDLRRANIHEFLYGVRVSMVRSILSRPCEKYVLEDFQHELRSIV